jgi:hypothetical protein
LVRSWEDILASLLRALSIALFLGGGGIIESNPAEMTDNKCGINQSINHPSWMRLQKRIELCIKVTPILIFRDPSNLVVDFVWPNLSYIGLFKE